MLLSPGRIRSGGKAPGHLFLVGPGGVGKSTVGPLLARLLELSFVDLDEQFCARIGNIGDYLRDYGYPAYAEANAGLLVALLRDQRSRAIIALSSGSLFSDAQAAVVARSRALVRDVGLAVMLLPGPDIATAEEVVIARQLNRGFGLQRESELRKYRARVRDYLNFADFRVDSSKAPDQVASEIHKRLGYLNIQG